MLPSIAKSGWLPADFLTHGPFGHRAAAARAAARPRRARQPDAFAVLEPAGQRRRLRRRCRCGARRRRARPARRCCSSTCSSARAPAAAGPVFWRGRAQARRPAARWRAASSARRAPSALFDDYARAARRGAASSRSPPDARLVQFVETQLAGAIGSASARVMVASVVEEEPLGLDDVMRILDEASQLRAYSHALEEKSRSLERATAELRAANEQLKSLDRLKDDFMSSVTHELRTPLTSIRALSELMVDDADMDAGAAPAVPRHHRRRDRAPEPAGQPGARHGQDRVRPRRVAQRRRRPARAARRRRCRPRPRCSASAAPAVELRRCPTQCRRCAPTPTG